MNMIPRLKIRTESSASLTTRLLCSTSWILLGRRSTVLCASSTCGLERASCLSTPSHPARASTRSPPSSSKSCGSRTRTTSPWLLSATSATWKASERCPGKRERRWRDRSTASLSRRRRNRASTWTRPSMTSSARSGDITARCRATRPEAEATRVSTDPRSPWTWRTARRKPDAAPSASSCDARDQRREGRKEKTERPEGCMLDGAYCEPWSKYASRGSQDLLRPRKSGLQSAPAIQRGTG